MKVICFVETYLWDEIEHDIEEKSSAVSFLGGLCLILEEWELFFDAVPAWPLVDVVQDREEIEAQHEPLHPKYGWYKHFLDVLSGFWCLRQVKMLSLVDVVQSWQQKHHNLSLILFDG